MMVDTMKNIDIEQERIDFLQLAISQLSENMLTVILADTPSIVTDRECILIYTSNVGVNDADTE